MAMPLAERYLPILLLFGLALAIPVLLLGLSSIVGPRRAGKAKSEPFECGNVPVGNARRRFTVQFFLVALLFMIFDVEVVFVYPWAVLFQKLGWFGFAEMGLFLAVLVLGLVYVWKKGALEWE
jgi:NADH-quinone oxidoreductase subunit A